MLNIFHKDKRYTQSDEHKILVLKNKIILYQEWGEVVSGREERGFIGNSDI